MRTTTEPNFLIAGSQRGGTTWLYHLLDAHPQVYMAKPFRPEPKYFTRDPVPGRDRQWYLATWFSDVGDAIAVGEKSTSYMQTGVARRIAEQFPDMKVVFTLRHPVERAISNFIFSLANGLETADCDYAMRHEEERLDEVSFPAVSVHPFAYISRGQYAKVVDDFLEHLPRAQIKIVLYEDVEMATAQECAALYEFLGVDPAFTPRGVRRRYNQHAHEPPALTAQTVDYLAEQFVDSNRRLGEILGRDLDHWNRPSPMVQRLIARSE